MNINITEKELKGILSSYFRQNNKDIFPQDIKSIAVLSEWGQVYKIKRIFLTILNKERLCIVCGNNFEDLFQKVNKNKIFCSSKCRTKNYREKKK